MTHMHGNITTKWHGLPGRGWHGHPAHEGSRAGGPCHPGRGGFTIVELLVVMGIVILLVTIGAGSINQLLHSGRVESGVNTLSAAVASTRAQANRGLGGQGAFLGNTTYKGVALLVTPADMRIVQHVATNRDGSPLLSGSGELDSQNDAYADVPNLDEIPLQRGTGYVGIARSDGTGLDGLLLFTPPFALRFNPDGQLISRLGEPVHYDGDYNGRYTVGRDRSNPHADYPRPYNPSVGTPGHDQYERRISYDTTHNRHIVPLERIEPVIGVIVFSMDELLSAGHTLAATGSGRNPINAPARDWLLEQVEEGTARLILFNRYTGTMLKDPR